MNFFLGTCIATFLSLLMSLHTYAIKINILNRHNSLDKYNKIRLDTIIISLPMLVYSGFRYNCAKDYTNYEHLFNAFVAGMDYLPSIGYKILCATVNFFDGSFAIVIFVAAAITILLVFKNIIEYSPNIFVSIFLFMSIDFYFESMSVFRQCIAIALCIQSIKYVRKKEPIKFMLTILAATSFHTTAIIFALVYLINYVKISSFIQLLILIIVRLKKTTLENIITKVVELIGYSRYYNSVYYRIDEDYFALNLYNIFIFLLFFFILNYIKRSKSIEKNENKLHILEIYMFIQFLSTCIISLAGLVPECHRVMYYFQWQSIISIPVFIDSMPWKNLNINKNIVYFFIMLIFGIFYFWVNANAGYFDIKYHLIFYR